MARNAPLSGDRMLHISAWMSAILFALFLMALIPALMGGIHDHERAAAFSYTGGCAIAMAATLLLLFHSVHWAVLVCVGALAAATGGYVFEPDFRDESGHVASLILIGSPTLIALLVGGGYLKAIKRRSNVHSVPSAVADETDNSVTD